MKIVKTFACIFCLFMTIRGYSQTEFYIGVTTAGGSNAGGTIVTGETDGSAGSVLFNFNESITGAVPNGNVIQGSDGNYYGTCSIGGNGGDGTVYKISGTGVFTKIADFSDTQYGGTPNGGLVIGTDNNFYGTCNIGGTSNLGSIFKVSMGGALTKLKDLTSADGANPAGSLILGSDSNFYGMCSRGGTSNNGTIFKIDANGILTNLRNLDGSNDGSSPMGNLVLGLDGDFYGTCQKGGANGLGTIFKISQTGNFVKLLDLSASTGTSPEGGLQQAGGNSFYGTCSSGGANNFGTIFKITSSGTFTKLKDMSFTPDGSYPLGHLTLGTDGYFYGICKKGGLDSSGTIFKISTSGAYTKLRDFTATSGGINPCDGLLLVSAITGIPAYQNLPVSLFEIYPNPVHNELNIAVNDNQKYTVSIKNILGQTLTEQSFGGKISFQLGSLPGGVWFVQLQDEQGRVATRKVVRQ